MNGLLALEPLYLPAGWESLVDRPAWLAVVLSCWGLALLVAIGLSWRERHALRPRRWGFLALLRGIALAAIAVGIVGIERHDVTERTEASRVVLLVDASSSMRLPAGLPARLEDRLKESTPARSEAAIELVPQLVTQLSKSHEVLIARFGQAVQYVDKEAENEWKPKFFEPHANDTRLGDALRSVLDEHTGTPLAAIVVLSDGQATAGLDPKTIASEANERHTRVHTIGFGPLTEMPRVELAALTSPQRVFSGDRFSASGLLLSRGGYTGATAVQLTIRPEGDETPITEEQTIQVKVASQSSESVAKFELPAPPPGRYTVHLALPGQPTAALTAQLESVDRKTNVLLIAGGPTRDFRFLRDQLYRDKSFSVDLLLQSAMGAVSQDANRLLDSFPLTADELDAYDAIVAFDPDWNSLGDGAAELLETWVSRQGGGLLLVPGAVHTGATLRQAQRATLSRLSPVVQGDTLLFSSLGLSASTTPTPLRLTPAGEVADFMQLERSDADPAAAWEQLEGFYSTPPPAQPKTGTTVYVRLGEGASASALLVEQFYGSGRVAYLASGETWRLRRKNPQWFTSFHTKFLRHLSQGRLLGNSQGRLFFDRDRYEVGETVRLRLVLADGATVSAPAVRLQELSGASPKTENLRLTPVEGQPGVFLHEWPARVEGSYEAIALLANETELSATTHIALPPRETAKRLRDEATLRAVAEASGGTYYATGTEALAIAEETPSRSETRTLLGPLDQEFERSLARNLLLIAIMSLTIEWTLRRLWRLA